MTLNLTIAAHTTTDFTPRISVVGVGGGGTNAVNNMVTMGLDGVDFLVANTDAQSLVNSKATRRVQLGPHLTQGLGAGAKPEIGRAAAEEATEELARHLEGSHMVFVTAGMGGGTGTGAAPVIARMARERGILTVGVVTKPFDFEGPKRRKAAESGIEELQQFVDTLIVIPNQNLFRMANERTTFAEAFKMADNVLYMGVRGVTDLMVNPGLVNLDFADIRTVMAEMGKAMMGTGEMEGEERAVKAAESAISNPLLEDTFMRGARGVLINITGGYDMTLFEVDEAVHRIRKEVDEDANIIFGSSIDETMNGRIRVSVVATGIDAAVAKEAERPKLVAVGGGVATPLHAVASAPVVAAQPARPGVVLGPRVAAVPAGGVARAAHGFVQPAQITPAQPASVAEPVEAQVSAEPVILNQTAEPGLRAPAATRPAAAPQPAGGGGFRNLFRTATGLSGLMRRDVAEPASAQPAAPRVEPVAEPAPRATVRAVPQEEMGLDIPTFLRRQSN
ncbi:cell division protein FtsZ [Roseomonas sp. AR75]|uniref:cell division protein FtsZ n=1 Tax=Roseomonas sp. AR75 TaxID=2562311 RepID=UPI0010BFA979|nr:cell division protein FtsZ [Roseomonas sp. AR75]